MKTCFYNRPSGAVSWMDMVDLSAEYGFDCLEIFTSGEFSQPDREFAHRFREYADEKGIKICCLSSFVDITGGDSREQVSRMKCFAEIAAVLGSPYLHHTICPDFEHPETVFGRREESFAKGVAGVREIFDHAQKIGVRTIYEDQAFIFNGLQGFGAFLETVDRPVGVVADFGNIRQQDEEILDFIKKFAHSIVHVHLKDSVLHPAGTTPPKGSYPTKSGRIIEEVAPGTGTVPLGEGIALLKELGYDGVCSLEWNTTDDTLRDTVVERVKGWL